MLLFSVVLDITDRLTKESFVRLVIEWNQGSQYESNIIPDLKWHGEYNVRFGDEKRWLAIQEYKTGRIVAIRYEKTEDDGSVWDTDYIMNFEQMKMAVRLDRSYTADALLFDPKFSTPHFITLLERNGYLKEDNGLPVSRMPSSVGQDNLHLVGDLVSGEARYQLPVVYVSKTFENEDPVEVFRLSGRLKGAAHVMVQENCETSYELRDLCNSQNEYNGAIGIYFPNPAYEHRRILYRAESGYDEAQMEKVIHTVIQYINTQMSEPLYTWQGVSAAIVTERLANQRKQWQEAEKARKEAEDAYARLQDSIDEEEKRIRKQAAEEARNEANKILDGFENEMQYLQEQIDELTRVNEALQYENQGMRTKLDTMNNIPILNLGEEAELYPGEIRDLILLTLAEASAGIQKSTRRSDVILDIIENNDYQKLSEQKAETAKRLLRSYDGLTGPLKQELEDLGFVITEDGKHIKLTYYGDERYQIILSKTPSDFRTGKNSFQKLNKMVF